MRKFFHSRSCAVLAAIIAAVGAWWMACTGSLPSVAGNGGIVASWSGHWLAGSALAPYLGFALTLLMAVMLIHINSTFNLLRSITSLQATSWLVLIMSAPTLVASLNQPVVSAIVVLGCMYILFGCYGNRMAMQQVFLIFAILSVCAGFDVIFIGMMPVFLLGCAQMRIFSLKAILAMLMGVATPWIIMLCFGVVAVSDISIPDIPAADDTIQEPWLLPAVLASALAAFVILAAWLQNLMKYLTYNAHSRAMLSMVTVMSFIVIIFAAINYTNLYASMPLLCVFASLQLAHLFGVVHTRPKSYIAIICFFIPFILLAIWNALLCM